MRKRNKVKQLNRVTSHRNAMIRNLATSLFEHERVVTTRARGKVLKSYAEKLITRAKKNLEEGTPPEKALHNKREVMSHLYGRDVVAKLFDEIAPRYRNRAGGYTRMIHLQQRESDNSQMSIIELVDRVEKERKPGSRKKAEMAAGSTEKKSSTGSSSVESSQGPGGKEDGKWYKKFMKKKKGD